MTDDYTYGYDAAHHDYYDETEHYEETHDNWKFELSDDQEWKYDHANMMWGFMHTWSLILGVFLWYDYPRMIDTHQFWKQACPSSAVSAAVSGSNTAQSSEVYA